VAAGDVHAQPGGRHEATTHHARAARRAVTQARAAKAAGDDDLAQLYARLAAEHVDRHLVEMRRRARRLP
jgi:hypothetical protein